MNSFNYKTLVKKGIAGVCFFCFSFGSISPSLAKRPDVPGKDDFERLIKIYGKRESQMDFKKLSFMGLLNKTKKSKGKIFLSKGKIAINLEEEMKTKIIFDGKNLWYLTRTSLGEKRREKLDFKKTHAQALISVLFNSPQFFKTFKFVSSKPKGRRFEFLFVPKQKSHDIEFLKIKVEKERILQAIIRWKSLKNREEYTFSNIQRKKAISSEHFNIENF